jgi:hypothetical protein
MSINLVWIKIGSSIGSENRALTKLIFDEIAIYNSFECVADNTLRVEAFLNAENTDSSKFYLSSLIVDGVIYDLYNLKCSSDTVFNMAIVGNLYLRLFLFIFC